MENTIIAVFLLLHIMKLHIIFAHIVLTLVRIKKESRKKELTDYERNIYNAVREYFDLAVYIIQQDTGIYIGERMARRILEDYISEEGHMYYWATLYNIPWMLLYFLRPRHVMD